MDVLKKIKTTRGYRILTEICDFWKQSNEVPAQNPFAGWIAWVHFELLCFNAGNILANVCSSIYISVSAALVQEIISSSRRKNGAK